MKIVLVGLWDRMVMPLARTSWLMDTAGAGGCPGPYIAENGGWLGSARSGPVLLITGGTLGQGAGHRRGSFRGMPRMPWRVLATSSGSA